MEKFANFHKWLKFLNNLSLIYNKREYRKGNSFLVVKGKDQNIG